MINPRTLFDAAFSDGSPDRFGLRFFPAPHLADEESEPFID
jgi:hypothetical protein